MFVRRKTYNLVVTQLERARLDVKVTEAKLKHEEDRARDLLTRLNASRLSTDRLKTERITEYRRAERMEEALLKCQEGRQKDIERLTEKLKDLAEERDNWRRESMK